MGIVEWAKSPWGQDVPIHIFWYLIYVSAIAPRIPDWPRHLEAVLRETRSV